jgi:MFS family permease
LALVDEERPIDRPLLTGNSRRLLFAALFGGIFVGTFDQTFVVTILPEMMGDLGIAADQIGDATWIVNGYLVGFVLALPTLGRAADVFGHTRVYVLASGVFIVGTIGVAVAPNLQVLAFARAVSAIGGGALIPIGLALGSELVAERQRPLVLAALLAGENLSSMLGPVWGAGLEGLIGWRAVFWLNIPLLVPCVIAVVVLAKRHRPAENVGLDALGIGLFAGGLLAVTLALSDDASNPRPLGLSLALGIGGLGFLVAFVWWELRARSPMIELALFRRAPVVAANFAYLIIGAALIVALVTVPLMRDTLYQGTTLDGAIAVIALLFALPVGGVLGGFITPVAGYRATAFFGICLGIIGFLWMYGWRDIITSYEMWPALLCVGMGFGLCDAPLVGTVVENARRGQRAAATGLVLAMWTVGMVIGLALLGSRGFGRFEERAADLFTAGGAQVGSPEYLRAIHTTYDEILLVTAGALVVAALAVLFLKRGEHRESRWLRVPGLL